MYVIKSNRPIYGIIGSFMKVATQDWAGRVMHYATLEVTWDGVAGEKLSRDTYMTI